MSRICGLLLACMLILASSAEAQNNTASYNRLADRYNHATPFYQQQEEEKEQMDSRYARLMADESFVYYMDTKTAKWMKCPNSQDEYIIDVWIRLQPVENGQSTQYSYPPKYFLEHYYLRPDKQQVQFLAELEVTGRPDNNVNQRAYDMYNWETLVPESVEESIYQAVLKKMKKKNAGLFRGSLSDVMEDVFRVSI